MRRFDSLLCLGVVGMLVLGGCQGKGGGVDGEDGDDREMIVSLSEVPQPVRAAFEKRHPNATVHHVEKETHADGTAHYEFEFTQNGKRSEVELDQTGAVAPEDDD